MSRLLRLATEADTLALGSDAARALPAALPVPAPFVIELSGELGAGKTCFARGLLQALGVTRQVRSPSYGLMELHEIGGRRVVHLDLYRLLDVEELENLGLRDFHVPGSLWLIEWPQRGVGRLPTADARLVFSAGAEGHSAELSAQGAAGEEWLARLLQGRGS